MAEVELVERLQPCPLCGNASVTLFHRNGNSHVHCNECGMTTGASATPSAARMAWNNYPRPAADRLEHLERALTEAVSFIRELARCDTMFLAEHLEAKANELERTGGADNG